jgi:hypothetical protein
MAGALATLPASLQHDFGRTPEQLAAAYAGMPIVGYEANDALTEAAAKHSTFLIGGDRWERLKISPAAPVVTRNCVSGMIILAPGPLGGFVATLAYRGYGTHLQLALADAATGRLLIFGDVRVCATAAILHASLDEIKDQRNQGPGVSDGAMWSLPTVLMPEPQASPIIEKRGPGRPRKEDAA